MAAGRKEWLGWLLSGIIVAASALGFTREGTQRYVAIYRVLPGARP